MSVREIHRIYDKIQERFIVYLPHGENMFRNPYNILNLQKNR